MHQVLYRQWRPQTFSEVCGQPHVTAALKNELKNDHLAHAYLFTGSRGTGKTSCAKILAKAVNCLHPVDGDPCNECESCRGIDSGTVTDVVEIDAASNNGVDNIRDLREEIGFTPYSSRYRVYIIDEVHMLSAGAFNALLKTLEEPPAHAIFVLATTEVHKLPATILSRCQRFDFHRIAAEEIAGRLEYIAGQENFSVDHEAALLLARLADGGMRDALSLTEQCLSRSRKITVSVVEQATGMAGNDHLYELSRCIREENSAGAMSLIGRLHAASLDMERLCAEAVEFYRQLMLVSRISSPEELLAVSSAELERLRVEAAGYSPAAIMHCLDTMIGTWERIRNGVSARIEMEMALLRLCSPELDADLPALVRRVTKLEDAARIGALSAVSAAPSVPSAAAGVSSQPVSGTAANPSAEEAVADDGKTDFSAASDTIPATEQKTNGAVESEVSFLAWADVLQRLSSESPPLYGVLFDSVATRRGDMLMISTENDMFRSLIQREGQKTVLVSAIYAVTGERLRIGLKKKTAAPEETENALSSFLRESRENGVEIDVRD